MSVAAPARPRLREAAWRDIAALARLDAALFGHDAWSEATWWAEFAQRPRRAYVVLEVPPGSPGEGEILGYAGVDLTGEQADVMTIAVSPGARGGGLGRRLLERLRELAAAGGATQLLLEVRADNAPAIALYEGAGFTAVHVRRRYYQPGDIDALIMRKDLRL